MSIITRNCFFSLLISYFTIVSSKSLRLKHFLNISDYRSPTWKLSRAGSPDWSSVQKGPNYSGQEFPNESMIRPTE